MEQAKFHDVNLQRVQKDLEKRMNIQLEDKGNSLISQMSLLENEKNQLKQKLEEKLIDIDRNFLTRERHDEIIREKNRILDEMKEELLRKELECNKELTQKMRACEERKAKEYEAMINTYRGNVKELETNNEEAKRKLRSLEKELAETRESMKNIDSLKRGFEGRLAEKTLESERNHKEKEEILRNLKGIEKGLEEKTMIIKRFERNNLENAEEIRNMKERFAVLAKEKSDLEKEKESLISDLKQYEKKLQDFEKERDRMGDFGRKNLDLEENYKQSLSIFRQNCDVLRSENMSLVEKLREKKEELDKNQREMLEIQRKNAQTTVLISENDELKTRENSLKAKIKENEEEINRKNNELTLINEDLRASEGLAQEYERKSIRIKSNFIKTTAKIQKLFSKLKEEKANLQNRITQSLNDQYKDIMKGLGAFPQILSRFLNNLNEKISGEKAKIEEKITGRYEEIMRNLKKKYEENERNMSESRGVMIRELEGKVKELSERLEEREGVLIKETEEKIEVESEKRELEQKMLGLIEKIENIEKNQENAVLVNLDGLKGWFAEVRDKFKGILKDKEKLEKRRAGEWKRKALEIQMVMRNLAESELDRLKRLKTDYLEILVRNTSKFDEKTAGYQKDIETLVLKTRDFEILSMELRNVKEELRKTEESKRYFIEMYESSAREMEERLRKNENELKNTRKECERFKESLQDLERGMVHKTEEIKSLKNEKSRFFEKKEDVKTQILKEKEMNLEEVFRLQKMTKKSHKNIEKNKSYEGGIGILENKVRELQKINRNILENNKRSNETERSFLRSPPIRNTSVSIDLKD